jgi:hypothetical protein
MAASTAFKVSRPLRGDTLTAWMGSWQRRSDGAMRNGRPAAP